MFKFLEFHEEKYAKVQSGTSVEYVKMRENAQKKAFANFLSWQRLFSQTRASSSANEEKVRNSTEFYFLRY